MRKVLRPSHPTEVQRSNALPQVQLLLGKAGIGTRIVESMASGGVTDTHYRVLGLRRTATEKDIRQAYKRAALEHHPDKNQGDDGRFKCVQAAYEVLRDGERRNRYDRDLRERDAAWLAQSQRSFDRRPLWMPSPTLGPELDPNNIMKRDAQLRRALGGSGGSFSRWYEQRAAEQEEGFKESARLDREIDAQRAREKAEVDLRRQRLDEIMMEAEREREAEMHRREKEEAEARARAAVETQRLREAERELEEEERRYQARKERAEARLLSSLAQLNEGINEDDVEIRTRAALESAKMERRLEESSRAREFAEVQSSLDRRIAEIRAQQRASELEFRRSADKHREEEERELENRRRMEESISREEEDTRRRQDEAERRRKEAMREMWAETQAFFRDVEANNAAQNRELAAMRAETARLELEHRQKAALSREPSSPPAVAAVTADGGGSGSA